LPSPFFHFDFSFRTACSSQDSREASGIPGAGQAAQEQAIAGKVGDFIRQKDEQ